MIGDVADQLTHSPELADLRKQLIRNAVTLQQKLLDEERDAARVSLRTARAYDRLAALQGDVGQTEDALASCEQALSVLRQLPPADLHRCGILQEDVLLRKAGFLKRLGHGSKALEIISGVQNNLSGNYEASAVVLRRPKPCTTPPHCISTATTGRSGRSITSWIEARRTNSIAEQGVNDRTGRDYMPPG